MATLTGMTLIQLRAATLNQIQAAAKARIDTLTKRHLIRLELAMHGIDLNAHITIPGKSLKTYRDDGQIESQLDVERDVLGAKTGSRLIIHTYFDTGEVDTITISERDANDVETDRKTIKHFRDSREPEASWYNNGREDAASPVA